MERGVDVVVGEANIRFRAPARFDDLIAIHAPDRQARDDEPDAGAGDPPRRRAADRGLAAAGLRRREDLGEDADPGLGAGGAGALRGGGDGAARGPARSAASRPRRPRRGRGRDRRPALACRPPSASSACQRATWRSISSRSTVRPRRALAGLGGLAVGVQEDHVRRAAAQPGERAIVRRVSGLRAAGVDHGGLAAGDRRRRSARSGRGRAAGRGARGRRCPRRARSSRSTARRSSVVFPAPGTPATTITESEGKMRSMAPSVGAMDKRLWLSAGGAR